MKPLLEAFKLQFELLSCFMDVSFALFGRVLDYTQPCAEVIKPGHPIREQSLLVLQILNLRSDHIPGPTINLWHG